MSVIILKCTESDQDVREYEIVYEGIRFLINFNLIVKRDTLILDKLNIEGERANLFGMGFRKMVKEVAKEFCKEFNVNNIEIYGTKRTSGLSKGQHPSPWKFNF